MKKIRIFSALIALASALPILASCTQDTPPDETGITEDTAAVQTAESTADGETERSQIKDSLPENLQFAGRTFSVYVATQAVYDTYVVGVEDKEGDIVNDAVHTRNLNVQERLDIKLNAKAFADTYQTAAASITALVLADDSTFDLFMAQQTGMAQLVPQKLLYNAYDLKYIDFEQPWWQNKFMNEAALGSSYRYLLSGDYFTHAISLARTQLFNKNLYQNIFGDPDALYREVLDGKWTMDRLQKIFRESYADLNGDGVTDDGDQLGFVVNKLYATVDGFAYGGDVVFTNRDKDGFIELKMISEAAVLHAERLNALLHETGVHSTPKDTPTNIFKAGKSVFTYGTLNSSANFRDMKDDFGYLPIPKSTEEQENYAAVVHDTALLGGVSVASDNLDITGAVLEALGSESYRIVIPAWYESALKLKYARDDLSSQMIDLIRDSTTTNFIFVYNFALNGIGQVYRTLVNRQSNDYVSFVQEKLPAAEQLLADIVKAFKNK